LHDCPNLPLCAYDRRGHTRSPWASVQRTVELHADDAAALIGALSLAPCILVGSSGGARIGVDLVRRYSHLFRAAVLSEPPIFGLDPESGGPGILRDLQPKIQASVAAGGLPAAVDAFFDYMCPGLWSQLDDAGKEPYRANCAELLPDLQMPPYQIALADLRRITTITTMVAGMTSLPTLQRVARVIADGLPNGRLVTLEGTGHVTYAEAPDQFADSYGRGISKPRLSVAPRSHVDAGVRASPPAAGPWPPVLKERHAEAQSRKRRHPEVLLGPPEATGSAEQRRARGNGWTGRGHASCSWSETGTAAWRAAMVVRGSRVDHIVPLTNGGRNDLKNLRTLCVQCHRAR